MAVDILGADIWVGNFHKWVCAPQGTSGIWASPQWRERLRPSSVGYRNALPYPQRFSRLGTDDQTAMLCVPAAINFLRDIGMDRIHSYITRLASYGSEVIREALGTQEIAGRFAARRPIALPHGLAVDDASALQLQIRIANELHTELSVTAPIGTEEYGTMIVSAFVYNHPSEYEQFARLLPQFLDSHR